MKIFIAILKISCLSLALLFSCDVFSFAGQSSTASQRDKEDLQMTIRAGDKLSVQVYREKELTGIFTVGNSGYIHYPLLGQVQAAGLLLEELKKNLTEGLGKDYLVNPQVEVSFEKSLSKSVSILGQVMKPGNYDLAPDMTLVKLISEAGGFAPLAAPKHVKIVKSSTTGKKKTVEVNVDRIMSGNAEDVRLEVGDLVVVPETFF